MNLLRRIGPRDRRGQLLRRAFGRLGFGTGGPPGGDQSGLISYSQQGEDMILHCLFQGHGPGFYVDVGAYHPSRFSNTHFFYLRGWRGINIDAMPGSMGSFREARPGDINLECAIGGSRGLLTYHEFDEPAVNGLSPGLSELRAAEGHFRLIGRRDLPTVPLAEVLAAHLPRDKGIDFLDVDAEGLDLEVLRSNDWRAYRPKVVLVEDSGSFFSDEPGGSEVVTFMRGQGYRPCAKSVHTLFLADESRLAHRPDRFFLRDGEVAPAHGPSAEDRGGSAT